MKTLTHKLHKLLALLVVISIFTILDGSAAQPVTSDLKATFPEAMSSTEQVDFVLNTADNNPKKAGASLHEMVSNARYWVEYLNNVTTIDLENVFSKAEPVDSHSEMNSDPNYWQNYLKATVEEEESGNVIDQINSDPYFWPHYLDSVTNPEA